MRSAQEYRERAGRAKRLAVDAADRELQERLEAIARGYEAVAETIEREDDKRKMDAQDFRAKAQRCRELLKISVTQEVRDQLCVWAEEFDAEAEAIESRRSQRV
jgi:hypothetical protein